MDKYNVSMGGFMSTFKATNGDNVKEKGIEHPTEQQLPEIISSQYNSIVELEDSVVKSIQCAKEAKDKAKRASDFTVHWYGGRKEAIELLQDAQKYSSEALVSLAEAQKKSFEYQTKLTEITKFLFGLGVSSIAMNRCVVRELELKLKGASDEDISDLAKQELRSVILQLKAQEDIMKKIDSNTSKVKEMGKQLEGVEETNEEQDKIIAENTGKITKHSKVLSLQQQKDEEHDKRISENTQDIDHLERHDEKQDKLIAVGIEKDKEHDDKISENAQDIDELERQDEEHDKIIADILVKINDHGRTLDKHSKQDAELERKIQSVTQSTAEMIADLKANISDNADIANNNITFIENKFDKLIEDMRESINKSNKNFENKLDNIAIEFKTTVDELKGKLESQKEDTTQKIEALENKINALDTIVGKKVWKIVVSVVAGLSLILNILQLIGVL